MPLQTGRNYNVNFRAEVTEGTLIGGGAAVGERLRTLASPGLKLARGQIVPAEVRNDANKSMMRLGSKSVEGSYLAEWSLASFDTLLEALLRSTWVSPVAITFDGGGALTSLTVNSSSQVTLSWIDNSNDELGFRIRRKTASSSGWLEVGTVSANVTAFQNVGLSPATTYLYQVIAFNSFGDSTPSNEIDATTLAQASNAISLSNGRASTGALPKNQSILYRLSVPANVAQLVIQTKGIGNADLYVRYGAQPQLNAFDCRSNGPTSSEQCIISRPVAGDWNIMVFGNTSSLSVYSVIGSYGTESTLGFDISRK